MPPSLKHKTLKIKIKVENFAPEQTLKELSLYNKYDLLGIYKKTDAYMKEQSIEKDVIFLFRAAIIRYSQEFNESIEEVVYQVMLHEMAHHFEMPPYHLKKLIEKNDFL
jgi:predicted Zn-dependent protease with MMP-like domain